MREPALCVQVVSLRVRKEMPQRRSEVARALVDEPPSMRPVFLCAEGEHAAHLLERRERHKVERQLARILLHEMRRCPMSLVSVIVALIVIGVVVYLVNTLLPIDARFKTVINALIGLALLLWVLEVLGIWSSGIRIGR